jgi:hypothetical protein
MRMKVGKRVGNMAGKGGKQETEAVEAAGRQGQEIPERCVGNLGGGACVLRQARRVGKERMYEIEAGKGGRQGRQVKSALKNILNFDATNVRDKKRRLSQIGHSGQAPPGQSHFPRLHSIFNLAVLLCEHDVFRCL